MPNWTRNIKDDVRLDRESGLKYNQVTISQAHKIAARECGFTMLDAKGAIRTFLDCLGFKDKGIFMPKGESLATWLEKLKLSHQRETIHHETIDVIKDSNPCSRITN